VTKSELMQEIEKHETEIDAKRAQRDAIDAEIDGHETALVALEKELYVVGWTKSRPRKTKGEEKGEAQAKRRRVKEEVGGGSSED
jgi:hypothetical protein